MDFKDKLIYARAKLNLSQEELASGLGVCFCTVNRWENGRTKPTKKAAKAFEILCRESGIEFHDGTGESGSEREGE